MLDPGTQDVNNLWQSTLTDAMNVQLQNPNLWTPVSEQIDKSNPQQPFSGDMMLKGAGDLLQGIVGGTSDIIQGQATGIEDAFKANQAGFNSQEAGLNATELWNKELFQEGQLSEKGAQMIGGERAAEAAQGMNVRSAASTSITNETANITAKDVFTLRNNAFMKAFGYEAEGMEQATESNLETIAGKNAQTSGLWGGITKFIGSGLKAAGEAGID
jgi:hypothetical protein